MFLKLLTEKEFHPDQGIVITGNSCLFMLTHVMKQTVEKLSVTVVGEIFNKEYIPVPCLTSIGRGNQNPQLHQNLQPLPHSKS